MHGCAAMTRRTVLLASLALLAPVPLACDRGGRSGDEPQSQPAPANEPGAPPAVGGGPPVFAPEAEKGLASADARTRLTTAICDQKESACGVMRDAATRSTCLAREYAALGSWGDACGSFRSEGLSKCVEAVKAQSCDQVSAGLPDACHRSQVCAGVVAPPAQ